jgi:YggT family protein
VIGNFFAAVSMVLNMVFNALILVLVINALLSWLPEVRNSSNPAVHFLERVSAMVCNPIRKLFPTVFGGLDLAPMIVIVVLMFLQRWLVPTLAGF